MYIFKYKCDVFFFLTLKVQRKREYGPMLNHYALKRKGIKSFCYLFKANKMSLAKYQRVSCEWKKKYGFAADTLIYFARLILFALKIAKRFYTLPF